MTFRYFRPKSLTWWAGVFSLSIGIMQLAGAGAWANELGRLVTLLAGGQDASPAASMVLGLGLIGIRDKLARSFGGGDGAD
jgi:hypothetical protein